MDKHFPDGNESPVVALAGEPTRRMNSLPATCPTCGAPLPPEAPGGWCPRCLGREVFGLEVGEEPSAEDTTPGSPSAPPDATSADFPFDQLEKIGEGAFAVVYRAEQWFPVSRPVAVKFIKPGLDSAEILARFELERQTLALLEHPHIARLYDAGATAEGRPYFVMELVEGPPLTTYGDARRLDLRARLELFITVCDAVQHAHQKAVLHRDLKPQHLLVATVGGKPVPKVIDFGLAKPLQPAAGFAEGLTARHSLLGTPPYLSPEQAARTPDIDTRSDIYSLGVILFEFLTGHPPIAGERLARESREEILRVIREEEAPRPSASLRPRPGEEAAARKRAAELRGDLDWIILKALRKDREQRYASAEALARDLRRHLAHEPVSAGPPGLRYRFGKTLRRHRALTATLAAAVALTVAFFTWHGWVQRDTNRQLRAALEEALALRSFLLFDLRYEFDRTGREDVLQMSVEQAEAFSPPQGLPASPSRPEFDPRRFQALTRHLHGQAAAFRDQWAVARQSFEREAELNRELWRDYPRNRRIALDLVAGHSSLAGSLLRLEEPSAARRLLEELEPALPLLGAVPGVSEALAAGHRVIVLTTLVRACRESGDSEAAHAALVRAQAAAEAYRQAAGPSSNVRLLLEPESEEARLALMDGQTGIALTILDRVQETLHAALTFASAASGEQRALQRTLILCYHDRLRIYLRQRELEEAQQVFAAAASLLETLRQQSGEELSLWRERLMARAGHDLADALLRQHKVVQAEEVLGRSARLLQLNVARPSGVTAPSADLGRQQWLIARQRRMQRKPDLAFVAFQRAYHTTRRATEEAPHDPRWQLDLAERTLDYGKSWRESPHLVAQSPEKPDSLYAEAIAIIEAVLTRPDLAPEQRDRAVELLARAHRLSGSQPSPPDG